MSEQAIPLEAEFTLFKGQLVKVKRRSSVRYRCHLATYGRLYFPSTGQLQEVWAQNLSQTGIGLNLTHAVEAGTAVMIRLKGTESGVTLKREARVVHSTQEVDGSWRVGCEFSEKLSGEELDALL